MSEDKVIKLGAKREKHQNIIIKKTILFTAVFAADLTLRY